MPLKWGVLEFDVRIIMSYDLSIVDKNTHEPMHYDKKHTIRGGTYCVDGTSELEYNITYNYARHFARAFRRYGDNGINCLNGKSVSETIPWIVDAINSLGDDISADYWEGTEGNAKVSLKDLLVIAEMGKDGIWEIT